RSRSRLADHSEELPVFVEYGDAPDQIGIGYVGMALCNVHITISRISHDVCRVSQGFGRISPHARFPERHQKLTVGTELDDNASLLVFSGKLRELLGARSSRVGHPHVSVSIDVDAMRPREHPATKAPDLLPRLIKVVDGVAFGAET